MRIKFNKDDIVTSIFNPSVESYKVLKVNYKTLEVTPNDGDINNCIYVCKKSIFKKSNFKDITPNITNLKYYKK